MRPQKSKPTLVITNPLNYVYFFRSGGMLPVIGSSRFTLSKKYWHELCGEASIQLYPVANRLETIIEAHEKTGNGTNADYITGKAVNLPYSFLGNSFASRNSLERKASIRSLLEPDLFPEFEIVEAGGLATKEYADLTAAVHADQIVIQIDFSTGGSGTYFIESESGYLAIRDHLVETNQTQRLVVSKRIQGLSFAVQCFLGGQSLNLTNWWHRDLVGLDGVCNNLLSESAGAIRYSGAVLQNIPSKYLKSVKMLAEKVGSVIAAQGYRGIFGVDIVVEHTTDRLYLIEVNPRVTAVSHIYAGAMHATGCETDFLTEGLKELIGQEASAFRNVTAPLPNDYFYLKLQNIHSKPIRLNNSCKLGVYQDQIYRRFGFGVEELKRENEIIVIPEGDVSSPFAPGERTFSIVGVGDPTNDGSLTPHAQEMIASLRESFEEEV